MSKEDDHTGAAASLESYLRSLPEHADARARDELAATSPPVELLTLLRFESGGQLYAVRGEQVREVISATPPTRLPGAPPHIRGIVIHRRQVVAVLDLERWLDVAASASPAERIVLIEHGSLVVGLCTSSSTQMMSVPADQLRALSPVESSRAADAYIHSVIDQPTGPILLLHVERLLDDAAVRA